MVDDNKALIRRQRGGRRRRLKLGVTKTPRLLGAAAWLISQYLRLVNATSRMTVEPRNFADFADDYLPIIAVSWHGQFILMPAIRLSDVKFDALVSRHTDGEVIARIIRHFGHRAHRGSGTDTPTRMHEKGGIAAFRGLADALEEGRSVFVSADHRPSARRQVSGGIISLARITGRPIVPLAVATSRSIVLSSWDRATINLPFSKGALVLGKPVWVPENAGGAEAEAFRREISEGIDSAADRAREIAGG